MLDLADDCGATCDKVHVRWSQAYALSGIFMLLSSVNALIQLFGVWSHTARAASTCCTTLLSCTNFAIIILVAIYRWNTVGKLAALSETPTKYDGNSFTLDEATGDFSTGLSDERTYESDASLIVWLWVAQIVFFITSGVSTVYMVKVPRQDDL